MLRLELARVEIEGLPPEFSWLQPDAASSLTTLQKSCGNRVSIIEAFRPVLVQIECNRGKDEYRHASPTKSGHHFGWSIDVDVKNTLLAFATSRVPELVAASRDRSALARWLLQFGWHVSKTENGHYDFLTTFPTVLARIESVYGPSFALTNEDVQHALNKLVGSNLDIDGDLGVKTHEQMLKADKILDIDDRGDASQWWRRVLAGATAEIVEVTS